MEFLLVLMFVFVSIGVFFLLYMFREAHLNQMVIHHLSFPDLPSSFDGWTVFFISDVHRRVVSEKIIEKAAGKADIVIIGGDLAEKGVSLDRVRENLKRLKKIAPIYFVYGNNDYEVNPAEFKALLQEMEVTLLDNCTYTFQSNHCEKLALMGIHYLPSLKSNVKEALLDPNARNSSFRILVSHDPVVIHSIPSEEKIQLVLSGHTHGGQIRIFGYGPYEKGGIKRYGRTILLTSNGYGTTALPLRLGAKPQSHLIYLEKT